VPASDPKDLFMECGTCNHINCAKHRVDMGRLSYVACGFPVSWMFEVEGVIPSLGDGWSNSSLGTRGGFCRMV
jgi:hypothetical protein